MFIKVIRTTKTPIIFLATTDGYTSLLQSKSIVHALNIASKPLLTYVEQESFST